MGGSDELRWFLGGCLRWVPELVVLLAPTVNSYKRFVDESWAPTRIAWSYDNRTAGFRLVGHDQSLCIELHIPGADCNPYLAAGGNSGGVRERVGGEWSGGSTRRRPRSWATDTGGDNNGSPAAARALAARVSRTTDGERSKRAPMARDTLGSGGGRPLRPCVPDRASRLRHRGGDGLGAPPLLRAHLMRIGLLECDHVHERFLPIAGDYADMFEGDGRQRRPGHEGRTLRTDGTGSCPEGPDDCDGWLLTGSSASVYDDEPWIDRLAGFVRAVHDARVACVGICFGHQLLGHALGGRTERATVGLGHRHAADDRSPPGSPGWNRRCPPPPSSTATRTR